MSEMDDVFDLRALVKRHGDKNDKAAWKRLEKWLWDMQSDLDIYRSGSAALDSLADALVNITPARIEEAQQRKQTKYAR